MGKSTDELTRSIEQTRENLSRDVDELTNKVSPSQIVHRQKAAAGSKLRGIREQVMGSAHDAAESMPSLPSLPSASGAVQTVEQRTQGNPLGAGLVAFGAGLVLSSLIPASRAEARVAQQTVDVAKEQGQPLLDEAKAAGQELADDLKQTAQQATEQVRATAQAAAGTVQDEARTSADHVKEAAPGN